MLQIFYKIANNLSWFVIVYELRSLVDAYGLRSLVDAFDSFIARFSYATLCKNSNICILYWFCKEDVSICNFTEFTTIAHINNCN